jgi:ABC-type sulfate transport system permease component
MSLFAFELPPVDFLYSIHGVILAEITVFTPLVMRPLMAGLRQIDKASWKRRVFSALIRAGHCQVIFRRRCRR